MTEGEGQPAPTPAPDPWAHRRGEPRTFAALWLAFLFTAAALALLGGGSLGLLATDAYRAAARVMLTLAGVGIGVLWPMLRLSQVDPPDPCRAMARDCVVVVLPLLALVLPQLLPWMAAWPTDVILALAAAHTAWVLLLAGLLARRFAGAGRPRPAAWAAMLVLVVLVLAGPAWHVLTTPPGGDNAARSVGDTARPALVLSPITAPLELTADRSWTGRPASTSTPHWAAIAALAVAAGIVWWSAVVRVARSGRGP